MHHLADEENPLGITRAFRYAVPTASWVFISHFRTLGDPDSGVLEKVMLDTFGRGVWRTDAQIAEYFEGTELLAPGGRSSGNWSSAKGRFASARGPGNEKG